MKKLNQISMPLFTVLPLMNHEFIMLKCPEFLMKIALNKSPASSENQLCFMDNYQLQQMNLLMQIGINFAQKTMNDRIEGKSYLERL